MFSKTKIETSMKDICAKIQEADAIVIEQVQDFLRRWI